MKGASTSRLTLLALCLALSLALFLVELRLPLFAAVPGFKLGLANIVTMLALVSFRLREALALLVARIFLGAFLSGNFVALSFSLTGGLFALAGGLLALRLWRKIPLAALGVIGALCHNLGQLLIASIWLATSDVFLYAPVLLSLAVCTGSATGFLAQLLLMRLRCARTSL